MAGGTYAALRASQGPEHARMFFGAAERLFDALGLTSSAEGIRQYRNDGAADVTLTPADVARHPLIDAAERSNKANFESKTFRGLSGSSQDGRSFLTLKDGDEAIVEDYWDRDYSLRPQGDSIGAKLAKPFVDAWALATNPDTYLRFGRHGVRSRARVRGRRRGDTLYLDGDVGHELGPGGDRFDFNPGQVGGTEARTLERAGEAAPFRTFYSRSEPFKAEATYGRDGSLTLRRSTWNLLR